MYFGSLRLRKTCLVFLKFFLHYWNLDEILKILKKKMNFIAYLFWKLPTLKDVCRQMSKKRFSRKPFDR